LSKSEPDLSTPPPPSFQPLGLGERLLNRGVGVRALSATEKPAILAAYLDRFRREVQRFFPLPAGAPRDAFVDLADRYPAFELLPGA
jgi:hypothetical protein